MNIWTRAEKYANTRGTLFRLNDDIISDVVVRYLRRVSQISGAIKKVS